MNYESRTIQGKERERFGFSRYSTQKGFSIVETMVAIAVLALAIVAPMTLAERGLSGARYARDQVTAFYLAQEAVEYVRSVRDDNNLGNLSGGVAWLTGVALLCTDPRTCGLEHQGEGSGFQVIDCRTDNCRVAFDSETGYYKKQSGGPFLRAIQIKPIAIGANGNAAAEVIATVSWQSGLINRSFEIREKIFNWYPAP